MRESSSHGMLGRRGSRQWREEEGLGNDEKDRAWQSPEGESPGNDEKERARQWREEEGLGRKRKRRKRLSSNLVVALSPPSSLLPPTWSLLHPQPGRCSLPNLVVALSPPSSLRAKRSNLRGWAATQGFFQGVVLISFPEMMNRAQQAKLADRL